MSRGINLFLLHGGSITYQLQKHQSRFRLFVLGIIALYSWLNVSGFITYTDSETWAGNIHPAQALRQYRSEFVGDAKAVVVGMTSNGFTLADPNDRGMLDVVGFDPSVPAVIADFVRE